jgi:hypothetical protein
VNECRYSHNATFLSKYHFGLYTWNIYIRIIKSRRMRWTRHVARMGEKRIAYRLLVVKPKGKRPLGRPRRRWVDNIRMDLWEVGWGDVDWIGLAKDRNRWRAVVNSVLSLRVPWNAGKLSSGLTSSGLSGSAQLHRVSYLVIYIVTEWCPMATAVI